MDEVVPVIKEAEREGWTVTATAKNHRRFTSPEGGIVITSGTPSDVRAIRNLTSRLRREGLDLRERRQSPRERHPSVGGDLEKLVVSGRELNPRVLQASIFILLEDGPLSEGLLVHALRSEGVKIVSGDLTAPLRALVERGAVKQVSGEYARVGQHRPRRPHRPCPPPVGTEGPVWCATRKGIWHSTPHNNRPSAEYRSLCGYLMPAAEEYEQRRPDCPYCLEKLETIVFL